MNNSKAKALKKAVYGDDSPGHRMYVKDGRTGTVYADANRRTYQHAKGRGRIGAAPQVKQPKWKKFRRMIMPFWLVDRDAKRKMLRESAELEASKKGGKENVGA